MSEDLVFRENGNDEVESKRMATQPDENEVWAVPAELRLQLLAALSHAPGQLPEMSYEEFLEWATEDTYAEWVDGKVIMPSPANSRHQMIASLLSTVLSMFVGHHRSGQIFSAPYQMKLAHSGREPDVLFLASEHFDRIGPVYLEGPADLVVEVISPDSIGRDRGDKFYEYQAAGIPEYWLIDALTRRAEFYQLDAAGSYQLVAPDANGVYYSRVLTGFWLRVDWLWQESLPTPNEVLREIGILK